MNNKVKFIALNGIVCALYVAITYVFSSVSFGPIQFRFSEVLTLLAYFNPFLIPGLTLGTFISNLMSPYGVIDMIVGTAATFFSLLLLSRTKNMFLGSLWPTIFCIAIGVEICLVAGSFAGFFLITAQICLSEFIVVTVIGVPLMKLIEPKIRPFLCKDFPVRAGKVD